LQSLNSTNRTENLAKRPQMERMAAAARRASRHHVRHRANGDAAHGRREPSGHRVHYQRAGRRSGRVVDAAQERDAARRENTIGKL
jgi:hypothetical protein